MNKQENQRIFLKSMRIQGFRSLYDVSLAFNSINIFIGHNGSGKTNLMLLFRFLHDIVANPAANRRYRSRAHNLIWRGAEEGDRVFQATLHLEYPDGRTFCYDVIVSDSLMFAREEFREEGGSERVFLSRVQKRLELCTARGEKRIVSIPPNRNSLRVLQEASPFGEEEIPEIDSLIKFIRGWRVAMINTKAAQRALSSHVFADRIPDSVPSLRPDGKNIAEFLHALSKNRPDDFDLIAERLSAAMEFIRGIRVSDATTFWGATKAIVFEESANLPRFVSPSEEPESAIRLLTIFSLLRDQTASLICLEEPERGLHPRLMIHLADAMRYFEAFKEPYPQILVTTHNPFFLDCFDPSQESAYLRIFMVTRKQQSGQTEISPVDPQGMKEWLDEYKLGELWERGVLEI